MHGKRSARTNWNALTPKERHKLIVDKGCVALSEIEKIFGSATASCETASNYVRGVMSDALGSAGTVLSEIGDAIAPMSEDAQHDSKLVAGKDY